MNHECLEQAQNLPDELFIFAVRNFIYAKSSMFIFCTSGRAPLTLWGCIDLLYLRYMTVTPRVVFVSEASEGDTKRRSKRRRRDDRGGAEGDEGVGSEKGVSLSPGEGSGKGAVPPPQKFKKNCMKCCILVHFTRFLGD